MKAACSLSVSILLIEVRTSLSVIIGLKGYT